MQIKIHQLNDKTRGPTMEAIVCRMKTVQASATYEGRNSAHRKTPLLRFIAVSATVPNIEDVRVSIHVYVLAYYCDALGCSVVRF